MNDDRPTWARRIVSERKARDWTQADAISAMRAHSSRALPDKASMLRQWRRWEKGQTKPDDFYAPLIAATFGTVTRAIFPDSATGESATEILTLDGMETLEIISRLQKSDVDNATLEAIRITADRLCSDYPHVPADQLLIEGRRWLQRITSLRSARMTFAQHREVLSLAGLIALLVGCVEYDSGRHRAAETTRQAALSLGNETGDSNIAGWAHEMRAWMALTSGDYHGVIAAVRAGDSVAGQHRVAVQLAGQEAKAWARIGDRRQTEVALDRGRRLLENLPRADNLDHHFVVDPAKFDFYAMDCYRMLREDSIAENLANQVINAGTDFDGTERSPMRIAEARVTLGVVAARQGNLESAIEYGQKALDGDRRSLPSLTMVSRELGTELQQNYQKSPAARAYLHELGELTRKH
jgi:tetratricopeptide (TPR) repeat protein